MHGTKNLQDILLEKNQRRQKENGRHIANEL